ncbi:Nucleolar protein 58 [Tilletia horrida]|uniref:Nucleolar protein 58 n=1 Tax=Tilletia horrida TaxID=155126 RepID=A0AAN6JPZ2_9BASI|nr:Nucleolar protein 58 [Tilletia horrida]KAK0529789.1 Nucleolar protein 58 [Tilletia horrida]KAK0558734.1 Nucleolar protein 58 [Tilletia horrida]
MLALYESAVGLCLFRLDPSASPSSPDLYKSFSTPADAASLIKLDAIHRFTSAADAVKDASEIGEGKLPKSLKHFLTSEIVENAKNKGEKLVVVDPKLGGAISKKLGIQVVSDSTVLDLYRGIRTHLATLLGASADGTLNPRDLTTMALGLSHSLSRYKLKFSPDKIDIMVVQAIALLDDLDKELNIYAMRVKEWYGWHFPEMAKIIPENLAYARCIRAMGMRTNASATDFSEVLPTEIEETLKAASEVSMGTEISDTDLAHILSLCDQVIGISLYRTQLSAYLQNRMAAIAPNLTALIGELVGARLISHAGSLMNLAKQPASTIQILGAEKALFRALKTKHDTPKYGLIYHTSLVGQAPQKLKGKMARMVATKAALSIRLDALADGDSTTNPAEGATIGADARIRLESRLRALESGAGLSSLRSVAAAAGNGYKQQAFKLSNGNGSAAATYNAGADAPGPSTSAAAAAAAESEEKLSKEERKALKKAAKKRAAEEMDAGDATVESVSNEEKKKKKKKDKHASEDGANGTSSASVAENGAEDEGESSKVLSKEERKALKKAAKKRAAEEMDGGDTTVDTSVSGDKKKKKKKKSAEE